MLRDRTTPGVLLLQALFWVSYVPLVLSSRPIWLLSSLAVTPFAFALAGRCLSIVLAGRRNRAWLALFLAAAIAVSVLLFPASAGRAWEFGYLRPVVERLNPHR
jgi:hypothetical protein